MIDKITRSNIKAFNFFHGTNSTVSKEQALTEIENILYNISKGEYTLVNFNDDSEIDCYINKGFINATFNNELYFD